MMVGFKPLDFPILEDNKTTFKVPGFMTAKGLKNFKAYTDDDLEICLLCPENDESMEDLEVVRREKRFVLMVFTKKKNEEPGFSANTQVETVAFDKSLVVWGRQNVGASRVILIWNKNGVKGQTETMKIDGKGGYPYLAHCKPGEIENLCMDFHKRYQAMATLIVSQTLYHQIFSTQSFMVHDEAGKTIPFQGKVRVSTPEEEQRLQEMGRQPAYLISRPPQPTPTPSSKTQDTGCIVC